MSERVTAVDVTIDSRGWTVTLMSDADRAVGLRFEDMPAEVRAAIEGWVSAGRRPWWAWFRRRKPSPELPRDHWPWAII